MKAISSAENTAFKSWQWLATQPRAPRQQGRALAEGVHLAHAALDAGVPIEAALLRRGTRHAGIEPLLQAAKARGAAEFELAAVLYDRIAPVEHGAGLMLVVDVPRHPLPVGERADLLYLDGVQDPGNAGTLLRTAAAAGIRTVLASPSAAALWAPKTMRAGQGAHFRLRLHEQVEAESLRAALDGPWYGADATGGRSLWTVLIPAGPLGWICGAEGAGLSAAARALCRERVYIPIDSSVESLNVAAAAAICLFERRRRQTPSP